MRPRRRVLRKASRERGFLFSDIVAEVGVVRMPKVPDGWFDADSEGKGHDEASVTNGQSESERVALGTKGSDNSSATGPKNPIGPVKGYPEMGRDAWRAGNDDVIVAAVNKYNSDHHYFAGDAEYMTPQMMKAWMMRESGGSPHAFKTDPFQVNNRADWTDDSFKTRFAGLSYGQKMTPKDQCRSSSKVASLQGSSE